MEKIKLHSFSGDHYEIGLKQGKAVRGLIEQAMSLLPNLDDFRLMKPRLLPTSLFIALAKRRASKLLEGDISKYYPEQMQRLRGIAEGAMTSTSTLLFLQSTELLMGAPTDKNYRIPACTSLGFTAGKTEEGVAVVAKNFDYINELEPFSITCHIEPTGRNRTLGCTMPPLPGMLDGMNEHGLTVTYNYAYTTDEPKNFVPLSIALQEMLETCTTTKEAVNFITGAKQGGHGALLMIADAKGEIMTVEITPNNSSTREPVDELIINTNHYHTENMKKFEVPHDAVWNGKIPEGWLGRRILESSEKRLARARELIDLNHKMDFKKICSILSDHGEDNQPSETSICRHGKYVSTIRSSIFYPYKKKVKVLYGKTCQNQYTDFTFL